MSSISLSKEERQTCLSVARDSILYGLQQGCALKLDIKDYSSNLQQQRASFVTLHKNGQLRGCIGALEASQPLIVDISEHAYAAAFKDPRFNPVSDAELSLLDLEISILSAAEVVEFSSEQDLLGKIKPGVDGLILESGYNRGTFLPSVWQQLPDEKEFLQHLKLKAGLDKNWWSDKVKISRYETFSFTS